VCFANANGFDHRSIFCVVRLILRQCIVMLSLVGRGVVVGRKRLRPSFQTKDVHCSLNWSQMFDVVQCIRMGVLDNDQQ